MAKRRRHTRGVSLGTVVTLVLLALVGVGCAALFPRLAGDIQLRVDVQQVGVAVGNALQGRDASQGATAAPQATMLPEMPPTAAPTATQPPERTLTITATGVVAIDTALQKACTGENGYAFGPLLENLGDALRADMNLATLANLVVANEKLTDTNMPADALKALRDCGLDTLCQGFFGVLNSGVNGLAATQDAIRQAGLSAYGAYTSAEKRRNATIVTVEGTKVALLSFQGELSAAGKKKTTQEEQGFAIAQLTLPAIAQEIALARGQGAEIVLVSLCWGKEGAGSPTATQRELAQGIADAGADIILGTHSGTLQPVELLTAHRADGAARQTLCAYSLGNLLISDRSDRDAISGALLHMSLRYAPANGSLVFEALTYTPTYVWRGKRNGKTAFTVLVSNAQPPEYVEKEQLGVMERSLALVRKAFEGSPVTEAQ